MLYRKPRLLFSKTLPDPKSFGSDALLIHDRLLEKQVEGFSAWTGRFAAAYAVDAGEGLKDLARLPAHLEKILRAAEDLAPSRLVIVVVGGGSVGDFGGFVASVLKRGVELVQIPSTWLAAIDSAHGGKNALNVGGTKNQIGTFYSASRVFLVRELLFSQDSERARDAFGELAKIALVDGGAWTRRLAASSEKEGNLLWKFLPHAIAAKYRIVARDPFEKRRIRQALNLGHTLGHVIEAYHGLSHGSAVAQGTLFCLEWSRKRGLLKKNEHARLRSLLSERFLFEPLPALNGFRRIPRERFLSLARADKKRFSASEISYVFIAGFGKTRLQNIPIQALLDEAREQGWVE